MSEAYPPDETNTMKKIIIMANTNTVRNPNNLRRMDIPDVCELKI